MGRKRLTALGAAALTSILAGCGAHARLSSRAHDLPTATSKPKPVRAPTGHGGRPSPARRLLGLPPVPHSAVPGYVLIADRNNNRILLVSPGKRVVWRFPGPRDPGASFRDPDDAFFTPGYRRIVTNEEFNEALAQIDPRKRRIVWSYGRAGTAGSAAGELSNPDDAYVLRDGDVIVADIQNCRVLRLSPARRILSELGATGVCSHDPPRSLLAPNGDTPLPGGGMLVTEIGGYVDRFDAHNRLVYSLRTPTSYPSDAQLLPNGNILVAGFDTPGRIDELTPGGRVVWTYAPKTGPGSLDRPSLAVRWPNGMIAVTDDWHHRVVVINPRTKRIVWEYGHYGIPSAAPGYLNKPDGLDLLPAGFRPRAVRLSVRRPRPAAAHLHVRRIGSLPAPATRAAAVVLGGGRILVAGGLVGGTSSEQVAVGRPAHLRVVSRLSQPTHDAAAAILGRHAYVFGGGESVSTDRILRIDVSSWRSTLAGSLGEPLSDLGAASVGGRVYLVGGFTGVRFATAVLRFVPGQSPHAVARLPNGLRYAGVASLGDRIYVAGGVTTAGESRSVLSVDPRRGVVRQLATLPSPVAHAPLVDARGSLYLIGGTNAHGAPLRTILRIDPTNGRVARAGRLPRPLADSAAVAIRGRIVVLGGEGARESGAVYALSE